MVWMVALDVSDVKCQESRQDRVIGICVAMKEEKRSKKEGTNHGIYAEEGAG